MAKKSFQYDDEGVADEPKIAPTSEQMDAKRFFDLHEGDYDKYTKAWYTDSYRGVIKSESDWTQIFEDYKIKR